MAKLTRQDLYSLEQYAEQRDEFRAQVMAHKKHRQVHIGPHATLYFEDRLTMHYQVQEMLRAERIFDSAGIEEELATYNPLIPDGSNWKATFMLEYGDVAQRQAALQQLVDIENKVWVQVQAYDKVWAIADEDLERSTEEKTSAVHFLRFELLPEMIRAVKVGAGIAMGIDHPGYHHTVEVLGDETRESLVRDLE